MGSVVNNIYFKSNKNVNELVIRAGQKDFNEINVIISKADRNKKIPQLNPFLVQAFVKKAVNRHDNIDNMKYTRQGKIMFTTKDPICAVQLLSLDNFMEIDVTTNIIWENLCSRFLIFDIPVNTPLEELAEEIKAKNNLDVVEMRRFLKQKSSKQTTPVLITVLGTTVPDSIKICEIHTGPCQGPEKCINCTGPHDAKSYLCPAYIREKKVLELKCRNHITTGEARRLIQSQNTNYSETVKVLPASAELQETVTSKFEALIQSVNEKFERLLQAVNEKLEAQTATFANMLHTTIESIVQNMYKIVVQSLESNTTPTRKKKLPKNLDLSSSLPMQWDAGGKNA
ncbi:hypothetical protein AVEN_60261-1 [Araneus ventricosus]|uniref:Uncharacterized protein n=1 Tax=Araneus ventricosus TaxID=182803 RepID=A0A4Y2CZ03_ARAVE|nr:hypothetical protein AVEN_60261-1 [Araneus ventricosus]